MQIFCSENLWISQLPSVIRNGSIPMIPGTYETHRAYGARGTLGIN